MTKQLLSLAAIVALVLGVVNLNPAQEKKGFKAKCPVTGKAAKGDCLADYNGGKVCFCCEKCPGEFKANTAKYAAKANHQLFGTGQAKEVCCPLTCKELDSSVTLDVAGVKVQFCCKKCCAKAAGAKGAAQIEMLFNEKVFKQSFVVKK